jgi:DNA repair protein RadC
VGTGLTPSAPSGKLSRMSTIREVSDGEVTHEVREESGLRWVERDGVWRARGDSGLYEVRHSHGKFHAVWVAHAGDQVPLGEHATLAEAFGAARRFDPGTGRREAAETHQCNEDCIGIHTHRDARPLAVSEESRPRYILYNLEDEFDSFGRQGLDRFIKVNEFSPEEAQQIRDLQPGAVHTGGGLQGEWALARLRPGEHEQTVKDRLRAERYDRAEKLERQLTGQETRLTYAERKKLPDSAFALPKRRELPLTNAKGDLDARHVDNAAARLSMMDHEGSVTKAEKESAHKKIEAAKKKLGIGASEAREGFAVVPRDEAAVARGQKVGPLTNPKAIYEFVKVELSKHSQECFLVIPIDIHANPLNDRPYLIAMGQRNRVAVNEEDVLRPVGDTNANGFICVHNHPSGSGSPSDSDRALTKRIRDSAKKSYPKVTFVDHVIVATSSGRYYSFAEDKTYKAK